MRTYTPRRVAGIFMLLIGFIFVTHPPSISAQSLFQETREMQQLLTQFAPPVLKGLDQGDWAVFFKGEQLSLSPGDSLVLDRIGRYTFNYEGGTSQATLEISYGKGTYYSDATFTIAENFLLDNLPDAIQWRNPSGLNGHIVKEDYYKVISLLGLHAAYQDTLFEFKTLENIYAKYKENPFLSGILQPFLYDYDLKEVAPYMAFDDKRLGESITKNLHENYNWVNSLYNQPELDFKKQILTQKDENYYQALEIDDKLSQSKLTIASEMANAAYSKVSGINSTVIIEGLSDFIVERAQEELNISFMDRFKQRMVESVPNEYSTLFPKTYDLFLQFEISNYKKLLQSARPSFLSDLQYVGLNLPKLLQLDKYQGVLDYSPAIYNLSLFYNMSQLVFTDHTIEDIMPFAFRHLSNRHTDLSEIVNLSIAASIEDSSQVKTFRKERNDLERQIKAYCEKAAATYQLLGDSHVDLVNGIDELLDSIDLYGPDLKTRLDQMKETLQFGWAPISRLSYDIPGHGIQEVFGFYSKYATNNLNGQGYFGDQINDNDPGFDKYEDQFSERPSDKAYIARGLELTRLLLKESFDERFRQEQDLLAEVLPQIKEVKKEVLLLQKRELNNRVKVIFQLRDTLLSGLDTEIDFLKSKKVDESSNIDLAALVYLKKILSNEYKSQETWTKMESILRMMRSGRTLNPEQIQRNDPTLTPEKIRFYLEDAGRQMNRIHQETMLRLDSLSATSARLRHEPSPILRQFAAIQENLYAIDETQLKSLDQIQANLDEISAQRDALGAHYTNIDRLVAKMDTTFCAPSLSKSRDNAQHLASVIELATHLLFSFKKETTNSTQELVWLDKSTYDQLMSDEFTRSIYLGLLYEELRTLKGTPAITKEGLATISTKLINTIFEIKNGKAAIQTKKAQSDRLTFEDYYPLIKTTVDLINTVVETPVFKGKALKEMEPALATISKISSEGLSLYQNINNKQFGFAIYNAMELFRVIADAQIDRQREHKRRLHRPLTPEELKQEKRLQGHNERIRNTVLLYGTFMADVLNATTSDDVKAALRAAAAPPGSSRLKRELDFNLGINSYLGLAVGEEKLLNPIETSKVSSRTIGLTVPIGIAMSWKFKNYQRSSYTLFLSVLDIGAVTSYRLNDNMASSLPKLEFNNFLAPGASLFYNFHKVPISTGFGWQLGPQTRRIDPSNPDLTSQASRFLFSVNVDVPLFNFVNGSRSHRRRGGYKK
ncbi:MAG: hypothetical protein R2828_03100 [Saprospiraceae bacterium]